MQAAYATHDKAAPDQARLRSTLARVGLVAGDSAWQPFAGGRTNHIWRVDSGGSSLVVKLYRTGGESPLFPNDAKAEVLALKALAGTGIAPRLRGSLDTDQGPCVLYEHVPGTTWKSGPEPAAAVLRRLHATAPPAGLRRAPSGPYHMLAQAEAIAAACVGPRRRQLLALRPTLPDCAKEQAVFLHGDPVGENIICHDTTATLIDWQCPAVGDPCDDLATFLSPAMQLLYRGSPLDDCETRQFLSAYGRPETTARLVELRPLYHWRMAAHCLWKAERGAEDYLAALELELAALERLTQ